MLGCPVAVPNDDPGALDKQASKKKDTRKEVPQKFKSLHIEGNLDSHGSNKPAAEAASSSSKFLTIGEHTVQMQEFAATDYGLYIWPCSIILGCYLHQHRQDLCKGRVVLELGCGTALVGVLAAKCMAQRVWLTDHASNVGVLENAKHVAELNGVSSVCSVKPLIWGMFCPWVLEMHAPDLIVGADILYDATEIDSVLATVSYFMTRNPKCVFIVTFKDRSAYHFLDTHWVAWGLRAEDVSVVPAPCYSHLRLNDHPRFVGIRILQVTSGRATPRG